MLDPLARPPLHPQLLAVLAEHGVDWILTGSVALLVFGARIEPGDLDVVPEASPANLRRLGALLDAVDAVPAHHPGWAPGLTFERCAQWRPAPLTERFDHMFVIRLGILDVPTRLTDRAKDRERSAEYSAVRRRLGLPAEPG